MKKNIARVLKRITWTILSIGAFIGISAATDWYQFGVEIPEEQRGEQIGPRWILPVLALLIVIGRIWKEDMMRVVKKEKGVVPFKDIDREAV